ncbi:MULTISPECIES: hypothetical protein [Tenacibaculum]|uniref:hypothetical protein n=1 Tax=Tenacibaculum TaxID=104267 RepID=UPI0021AEFB03|nr:MULTISPECIES: hypothetical protein [Tenacibaculum]MCT4698303.1 hypothetical protein [Tenacibaculum haliotis]WBX70286.1 hypothetical protein PG912_08320 [Tenacibaculum retecalamus]
MKTRILLLVITIFGAISISFSQNVDGYTFHESSKGVSLYYKQHQYGVTFRAVNKRKKYVYVKVFNVVSTWSNGKTRRKDVNIGFVASNKASNGGGLNNDNYAKIKSWRFDSWKWSEKSFSY